MALRKTQGQRGKYLTRELSSTRNPVEDMCAIVSKFQSAKIGDHYTRTMLLGTPNSQRRRLFGKNPGKKDAGNSFRQEATPVAGVAE